MKEQAKTTQIDDYRVKYDFSSFRLVKRLRMAIAVVIEGGFIVTGKEKNKTTVDNSTI